MPLRPSDSQGLPEKRKILSRNRQRRLSWCLAILQEEEQMPTAVGLMRSSSGGLLGDSPATSLLCSRGELHTSHLKHQTRFLETSQEAEVARMAYKMSLSGPHPHCFHLLSLIQRGSCWPPGSCQPLGSGPTLHYFLRTEKDGHRLGRHLFNLYKEKGNRFISAIIRHFVLKRSKTGHRNCFWPALQLDILKLRSWSQGFILPVSTSESTQGK